MKKLILILAAIAIAIPAMAQAKADPNIVVILRGAGVPVESPLMYSSSVSHLAASKLHSSTRTPIKWSALGRTV